MFGKKMTTDVLVVGAGPVGMTAALLLARRGIDVQVVDEQWRTAARSYALALHPRSLSILDDLGLTDELLTHGRRVPRVGLWDSTGRRAELDLGKLGGPFPFLLVLPQSALEGLLEERLKEEGVEIRWNHRLANFEVGADGVHGTIERLGKESTGYSVTMTEWLVKGRTSVSARFLVGADGHRSVVRRQVGIEFEEVGPAASFAVFECSTSGDPGDEMRTVLDSGRASAYWPLPGDRFRWSFEIDEETQSMERAKSRLSVHVDDEAFPYLEPARLPEFLGERAPWFDLPVDTFHWSVGIRFERRLATEMGRGPVVLVGDAAHLAGPVGIQSMNGGMRESEELAETLGAILRDGSPTSGLDNLRADRRAAWRRILEADPIDTSDAAPWVAERAATIVAATPASGPDLDALLAQVGIVLPG